MAIQQIKHTPSASSVQMTQLVLPSHANALGTIFGGQIMSWIDIAGAIAAGRHARCVVVTASIDALHFLHPVKVGEVVRIQARVNYVSRTSMEVGARVDSEDPLTGKLTHTATAYATFVALDHKGKPSLVPPLELETQEDRQRYADAQERKKRRLAKRPR